ncbi:MULTISPECIES: hypothetical protein [Thioalkalivibrio]|uniref:hypothetical protein n=1 Tax=Thioalkalivibrio TaxID=106633 RepID=UPI000370878D|nr:MULTISPECIES: hypothetical protein [Thioalkalivibrio]OOC50115.1 hypothetical protein B0684_03860 [Thioalkalivibrio versutus]
MQTLIQSTIRRIGAGHPSLPGHFPGHPVVPGVVILDQVAAVAHAHGLGPVEALPQVKFLAPLGPETAFRVEIDPPGHGGRQAFRVLAADGEAPVTFCAGQLITTHDTADA